jgi:hypothetical protein
VLRTATSFPKPVRVLKVKKRKKANSRTLLERRLDALVREIVLDRDGYCVCPAPKNGHGNAMQCGHLISRAKKAVRWSLLNCSVQCNSCNFIHEHHPHFYTLWFIREFTQNEYERLIEDSEEVRKMSIEELESLISNLTAIQQRQRSNPKWKPRFSQKKILSGEWRNETTVRVDLPRLPSTTDVRVESRS